MPIPTNASFDSSIQALCWDIKLSSDDAFENIEKDLAIVRTSAGLDLGIVAARDNLKQALTLALTTELGSDPFNGNYGFDGMRAIAEETDHILMKERIRIAVVKVLMREPRVRKILDIQLGDDQFAKSSRSMEITVCFENVDGKQDTATISKMVNINA